MVLLRFFPSVAFTCLVEQHRDRQGVTENAGLHDQPVQPH